MKGIHFFVVGDVQGVSFRFYSSRKARLLGLTGFVKNLPDRRVEVAAEGEDDAVNEFLRFCKTNPGFSEVNEIDMKEEKSISHREFNSFEIRY